MDPKIKAELEKEIPSEFHQGMLTRVNELVRMSRNRMREQYPSWDRNDEIYRNRLQPDKEDRAAADRKEPVRMVLPLSYAQVQSFVAFCFQVFTQRERLFELLPVNADSHKAAKLGEAFLQRDLTKNKWESVLYQFLLDVARFGFGVIKTHWCVETEKKLQQVPTLAGGATWAVQDMVKFMGNAIRVISPYQFFPDPRLPIARFQEGEFVAAEMVFSRATLRRWEANGEIAGMKWVPKVTKHLLDTRGETRVYGMGSTSPALLGSNGDSNNVILTECQIDLVPADFLINGEPMGEETVPVKYAVMLGNDSRVLKCAPLGYIHGEYTYDIGEYNPDIINFSNGGLQDSIDMLQDAISWFVNSRITNVRKIIGDRMIVDPAGVEMNDIYERKAVIRLKPNVSKQGVDNFIKQLAMQDVTTNHVQDVQVLRDFVQEVTGVNDTLMGQTSTGRRSATENRNVTASAAARIKMIALLLYRNALEPMGRKMLSNLRDGLDVDQVVRLMGTSDSLQGLPQFLSADKTGLIGNYDFETFDGTIPSERNLNAQALGELLAQFVTNPQAALALEIDPRAVLFEWLELRGVRNPERFRLAVPIQPPGGPTDVDPAGNPIAGQGGGAPSAAGESILPQFGGPSSDRGTY